jgi:hypothetical protein
MALHVFKNIDEDFSVIINKLLSTKYTISILYLTKLLIPTILTHFFKFWAATVCLNPDYFSR